MSEARTETLSKLPFDPAHALRLQVLAWVAAAPRTYEHAMDAWRSTCPRLSIWEDAILDGLVAIARGATRNQSRVALTPKGRALLAAADHDAATRPRLTPAARALRRAPRG
jgi:hypothetical protein